MTSLVIGIDPGLSGACAIIDKNGLVAVADMPVMVKGAGAGRVKNEVNAAALSQLMRDWVGGNGDDVMVACERVSSMPQQGVAGVFSLGDSIGCVRGVVAARGYQLQWVTPQRWKKHFSLSADKELARARAIQLYPGAPLNLHKHHGRAESILIARWAWEVLR